MEKLARSVLLLVLILAVLPVLTHFVSPEPVVRYEDNPPEEPLRSPIPASSGTIEAAFRNGQTSFIVRDVGSVTKILADDLEAPRHQRFLLRLSTGHTILIAHNIDIAPRISTLSVGDAVEFLGVYEWNEKGGVVHWTHHDPDGRHASGYLYHAGRRYSFLIAPNVLSRQMYAFNAMEPAASNGLSMCARTLEPLGVEPKIGQKQRQKL